MYKARDARYIAFMSQEDNPGADAPTHSPAECREAFLHRGQAAWEHYMRTGRSVPADALLFKLQAALGRKRVSLAQSHGRPTVTGRCVK